MSFSMVIMFNKIDDHLSSVHDYMQEHLDILLQQENCRLPFESPSPQMKFRPTLVEWMKKIAVNRKLQDSSIHLAVYILDVFMGAHNIAQDRLHLVVLVCLLLATKFEELDDKTLKPSDINKLVNNTYSLHDYFSLEIIILKHINWRLLIPTVVHFSYIYIEYLLTKEDLKNAGDSIQEADFLFKAKSTTKKFMDYVLDDIKLTQAKPSMVAAAIMALTRSELNLENIWSPKLKLITGYNIKQLKGIMVCLMEKHTSKSKKRKQEDNHEELNTVSVF